jgi:hypothetical protein
LTGFVTTRHGTLSAVPSAVSSATSGNPAAAIASASCLGLP